MGALWIDHNLLVRLYNVQEYCVQILCVTWIQEKYADIASKYADIAS